MGFRAFIKYECDNGLKLSTVKENRKSNDKKSILKHDLRNYVRKSIQ